MAYADQAALAADVAFQAKVRVALATAAVQVMGESKSSMTDEKFGKRQDLAYQVLIAGASGVWLEAFVWATVANAAITSGSSDGDIQFTVNASWDDLSGVKITD